MSDPRTAFRAEPLSERENVLNVVNSRDALEFAARVLQTRASMVPVGHEQRTKGLSTYNWLIYAVLLLRREAAFFFPGDAPQPCEWREDRGNRYAGCLTARGVVVPHTQIPTMDQWKACPYCTHPLGLVPSDKEQRDE